MSIVVAGIVGTGSSVIWALDPNPDTPRPTQIPKIIFGGWIATATMVLLGSNANTRKPATLFAWLFAMGAMANAAESIGRITQTILNK